MSKFDKPHLDISALAEPSAYKSPGGGGSSRELLRVRDEHGQKLIAQLEEAFSAADERRVEIEQDHEDLEFENGSFLEIELGNNAPASALNQERTSEGTRQSAVKISPEGIRTVTLFVPDDARETLAAIFEDYTNGELTGKGEPKKKTRVDPIENIRHARLMSFWRDVPEEIPQEPGDEIWWALWCFRDHVERVVDLAEQLGLQVAGEDTHLHFPETIVIPAFGSRAAIEILLFATAGIAELRRASDNPHVFTHDLKEYVPPLIEDLAERITWPSSDVPAVCVLDTGVNRAHPLLEPAVHEDDLLTIQASWGVDDHAAFGGHGTCMAGLALHGDLIGKLGSTTQFELTHRIESVKLLPPDEFPANDPHSYGPLTKSAVSIAEVQNPDRNRIFCMAVTNENRTGAEASAWSSAIDQLAAGVVENDGEEKEPSRLIVLSAGNIQDDSDASAIEDFDAFPIEDPAQAWNALTIGGYTQKTEISELGFDGWTPFSEVGEASPYSRNSVLWDTSQSAFKPELVFEAGNRARSSSGAEALSGLDSLSLLTTSKLVDQKPLDTFWATSAAAAQGSRLAARLHADLPEVWPETLRALMVHSARWTPAMQAQLDQCAQKTQRQLCLRRFGYGVPEYERATASAMDSLALVAEREIQPFRKEGSKIQFNEGHFYALPWPQDVLEGLENTKVRLKVTLSYFIEPNPSFSSAIDPARYQSFGLRFDLKRSTESMIEFQKRCNKAYREEGYTSQGTANNDGWVFGQKSRSAGSLQCDIWEGEAIELASRDSIFIFPTIGWWAERKGLKRFENKSRYSLVISLETPDLEVDLYTPIENQIENLIEIAT